MSNEDNINQSNLEIPLALKYKDIDAVDGFGQTRLHRAASTSGNIENLKQLLEKNPNINATDNDLWTPLHLATRFSNLETVSLLLENNANIHAKTRSGLTPLHTAILCSSDLGITKILLEYKADTEAADSIGKTPLHYAVWCHNYDYEKVKLLLENKANVKATDSYLNTPLHAFIYYANNNETAKLLLENGAPIGIVNKSGKTPLSLALDSPNNSGILSILLKFSNGLSDYHLVKTSLITINKRLKINPKNSYLLSHKQLILNNIEELKKAKLFIKHCEEGNSVEIEKLVCQGVDLNIQDSLGDTGLHKACKNGHLEVIDFLINNNADTTLYNQAEETPLTVAIKNNKFNAVESLISKKGISNFDVPLALKNIEAVDELGKTILHRAASPSGNINVLKPWLEKNVNINATDKSGRTPLHLAIDSIADIDIIKTLLQNNANINAVNGYGTTPLHLAIIFLRDLEIIELLLKNKANVAAFDGENNTPLHLVMKNSKSMEIALLLLENGAPIEIENRRGDTPFSLALDFSNNREKLSLLLKFMDKLSYYHLVKKSLNLMHPNDANFSSYNPLLLNKKEELKKAKLFLKHCEEGSRIEIEKLVNQGVDINIQDSLGDTGLHKACKNGHTEVIDFLLNNNADTTLYNETEETPFTVAIKNNKFLAVQSLISKKGINSNNLSDFIYAAENNYEQSVHFIIDYLAKNNSINSILNSTNFNTLKHLNIDKKIMDDLIFLKDGITLSGLNNAVLYTTMNRQWLNIGNAADKVDVIITFQLIKDSIYKVHFQTGTIIKTMFLKAHADNLGKINRFEFYGEQKNNVFKVKGSSAYNEDTTHKMHRNNKMMKVPNILIFEGDFKANYSEDFSELIITFKNPKCGTFTLSKTKKNEDPIPQNQDESSKLGAKNPELPGEQKTKSPPPEPQQLFSPEQISGHYYGEHGNINYQVYIPLFGNDNNVIDIEFTITQNNQQTKEILKALAQTGLVNNNFYTALKAAVKNKDNSYKCPESQLITFNGQCWKQGKKKKSVKPLCFTGPIKFDLTTQQLTFSTSRGDITLQRNNAPIAEPEREEIEEVIEAAENREQPENNIVDSVEIEQDEFIVDIDTDFYELDSDKEDELDPETEEKSEVPEYKKQRLYKLATSSSNEYFKISKEDIKKHGDIVSKGYEETSNKIVNRSWPSLQKAMNDKKIEEQKALLPSIKQVLVDSGERPAKLNPHSSLDDCPLYNIEEPSKSIWFGNALKANNTLNKAKKIVINLGNFNQGFERFSQAASWCSFYDSTLGDKNRHNGINTHCSYHRHGNKEYLYISHHGLFLLSPNQEKKDEILLTKLPDQNNKTSVTYLMKKSLYMNAADAYKYINIKTNYVKLLDDLDKTETIIKNATIVKDNLSKSDGLIEVTYGHKKLGFSPKGDGDLFFNNIKWRRVLTWNVQMINDSKAFVYVVFINNKNLPETLSFKILVNHNGEFMRVIKK